MRLSALARGVFRTPILGQALKGREFLTAPFTGILGFLTAFIEDMALPAFACGVFGAIVLS
jgi:hypothetical protein